MSGCTSLLGGMSKVASWRCGRALDLRSRGRGFESRPGTRRKNLGQVSHTYVPLSPSSISWYSGTGLKAVTPAAGKVTAGLAESNGGLPWVHDKHKLKTYLFKLAFDIQ